ncbi:hypothetical protein BDZ94DRAFT_1303986 [Collybia nuda]|uniref:Uncharacterized protein n=1 Tax=Collybia nuda TaxID=64659 RepID=A0A9P5YJ76_9AGAR|nr:hypothetical protein BDZ94DRAFT_1303986 [Collybia nuda]
MSGPLNMIGNITAIDEASTSVNIVHGTHSQLVAFLFLNIWPAHFGIPALLAIILFSKKIQRHGTFINLCVTFFIVGISSSLLAYAGKTTGPEPSKMLCLLQASLLYGFPPMTSVAAFMLVFQASSYRNAIVTLPIYLQMFLVVRASYYGREMLERDHVLRFWMMLISPYVAFFVAVLATAIIGAGSPRHVSRNRRFFYCSVESLPLTNTLTVFAAIVLFATVFLEAWAMVFLYKRYHALKNQGAKARSSLDLSMPIRILAFGFYLAIALRFGSSISPHGPVFLLFDLTGFISLSLLSIKAPGSPVPDIMIATAATVLLLIFGTQRDIMGVICFWRGHRPSIQGRLVVSKPIEMDYNKSSPSQGPEWPRFAAV